jgi:hypothetical protein
LGVVGHGSTPNRNNPTLSRNRVLIVRENTLIISAFWGVGVDEWSLWKGFSKQQNKNKSGLRSRRPFQV